MGLISKIASLGVSELITSAGTLAKDLRYAITGDLSQEQKASLQEKALLLEEHLQNLKVKQTQIQADIIVAEAKGASWLQRNWRPLLMVCCIGIVANNYIVYPYLQLFFKTGIELTLPSDLYALMKIGVGGYVVGRSAEKIAEVKWGEKGNNNSE